MTKTNVLKGALATLLVALPLSTPWQGLTANFEATVVRTLVTTETDDDGNMRFGGCMVLLDKSPTTEGLECENNGEWVAFSCSGDFTSKSNAMRMFDSAQLAFMAKRRVRIWVDDTRQHNGWCFASRLDVLHR